jgi:hypothetical protein
VAEGGMSLLEALGFGGGVNMLWEVYGPTLFMIDHPSFVLFYLACQNFCD